MLARTGLLLEGCGLNALSALSVTKDTTRATERHLLDSCPYDASMNQSHLAKRPNGL